MFKIKIMEVGKYIRTEEIKLRMSEGCKRRDPSTRLTGDKHPNYVPDKNHNCVDCGKKLRAAGTLRCLDCYNIHNIGKTANAYKSGGYKIIHCEQCGIEFRKANGEINRCDNHFCSKSCGGKWKSINKRGENSSGYKNGNTTLNMSIRLSANMRSWRKSVFERDNYTCTECGDRSCKGHKVYIEAHHIKEFAQIIFENNIKTFEDALNCAELWNISNGATLCRKCHDKTKKGKLIKENIDASNK